MSLQTRLPTLQEQLDLRISQCLAGQKARAWEMAQALARVAPDFYRDLPDLLKAAMLGRNK